MYIVCMDNWMYVWINKCTYVGIDGMYACRYRCMTVIMDEWVDFGFMHKYGL